MPVEDYPELSGALLDAVRVATQSYHRISGGIPIDEAPEALVQTEIGKKLAELDYLVTLESSAKSLLQWGEAETRGRLVRNGKGRIDIVAWSPEQYPIHLIEVKKLWQYSGLNSDAHRLKSMMRRGGSFSDSFIVAYAVAQKEDTLHRRFHGAAKQIGAELVRTSDVQSINPSNPEAWNWKAGVFQLSH